MSADNGIYIAKFPDGYRVTDVVGCIENIDYYEPNTQDYDETLQEYFGGSPLFKTKEEAYAYASTIESKWYKDEEDFGIGCPIEYGVCYVGEYPAFIEGD